MARLGFYSNLVCLAYRGTQIECLHYIIRSKRNNVNEVGTSLDVSLCNHETGPDDDSVIDEFPFIYLYFVIFGFLWSLLLLLLLSCRCRFSCTLSMRSSQDWWSELLRKSNNNNNKYRVGLLHLTTFCVRKLICVIRFWRFTWVCFLLLLLPRPVKTAPNFKTPQKKSKKKKQVIEEETWKSNLLYTYMVSVVHISAVDWKLTRKKN
jgi:hypothetical protein